MTVSKRTVAVTETATAKTKDSKEKTPLLMGHPNKSKGVDFAN
jgi:hypothetical protein